MLRNIAKPFTQKKYLRKDGVSAYFLLLNFANINFYIFVANLFVPDRTLRGKSDGYVRSVENFPKSVENLWRICGNTFSCCGKGVESVGKKVRFVKNCKSCLAGMRSPNFQACGIIDVAKYYLFLRF